jgi:hypothetical protein
VTPCTLVADYHVTEEYNDIKLSGSRLVNLRDLHFDSENGGSMVLRSVGKLLIDYTASVFVIATAVRTLRSFRLEYPHNSSFVFPCCALYTVC